MKRSTRGILTTHAGSLPPPQDLLAIMTAKQAGEPYDRKALIAGRYDCFGCCVGLYPREYWTIT